MWQKGNKKKVSIYDTTLRDGTQSEDISFTVDDKIRIVRELDRLGIHYAEGGWPGSNVSDIQFFQEIRNYELKNIRVVAFGSTIHKNNTPENDPNLQALLESRVQTVTIFGKSWDIHVKEALKISLEENLRIIRESLTSLKKKSLEVIYDAEHFFDGFKADREYAMQTLKVASEARVDCITLCDTNGGTLPNEIQDIFLNVKKNIRVPLGIHTHNDSELAVANALIAVQAGASQVHGTINGFGERCGNANLCSLIPNLKLKLGIDCISDERLTSLKEVSRFVNELANIKPNKHQPYVGDSSFAHKGGIHVNAILKKPETYEHIKPEWVGNQRRVLISELSGKSNIIKKAKEFNINLKSDDPVVKAILKELKELESKGFQFEAAEASFELLMSKALGTQKRYFDLIGFRVINEKRKGDKSPISEATIQLKVGGETEHTAAMGNGPVNALDNALRKALYRFYPKLKEVELLDYKVRVLEKGYGTGSMVRVLVESGDKHYTWGTVGVSENIVEASWQAIVDSLIYKLYKNEQKKNV
ncbi:MAG: citramalate synthase [Thermodesulfobacteriota bacterium]|nr:citramalate synthase [Thermodesulfobacteriota bacterium]